MRVISTTLSTVEITIKHSELDPVVPAFVGYHRYQYISNILVHKPSQIEFNILRYSILRFVIKVKAIPWWSKGLVKVEVNLLTKDQSVPKRHMD